MQKNTDEQNLISEINAPEQRVDPDNVTEPALAPTQRKGVQSIKELWLKFGTCRTVFSGWSRCLSSTAAGLLSLPLYCCWHCCGPLPVIILTFPSPLAPHRPACHYRPNYKTTMTYPSPKFPLLRRHKETGRAIRSKRVKRWRNCSAIITCQSTMFFCHGSGRRQR